MRGAGWGPEDRLMALALVVGAGLMLAFPLGLGHDYPNHLARVHIEAHLAHTPALAEAYRLVWGNIPDLAMDLVLPPLARLIGTVPAGALFNALAVTLLPLGAWVLARRWHGRATPATLLAALVPFGALLAWGFMNYVFALGAALLLFAAWSGLTPGWRRSLLFSILATGLYFAHLLAFLALGYLVLAWEGGRLIGRPDWPRAALARLVVDGPAFLPGLLLLAHLLGLDHGLDSRLPDAFGGVGARLATVQSVFDFHSAPLGLGLGVMVGGLLMVGLVAGGRPPPERLTLLIAVAALVALCPLQVKGIWGLHLRYGPLLLALLAAAVPPPEPGRRRRLLMVAGLAALVVWGNAGWRMAHTDRQHDQLMAAFRHLPEGSRLIAGASEDFSGRRLTLMLHAVGLAVIARQAYVVDLFTNTSPVKVVPDLESLHRPQAWPLSAGELAAGLDRPLGPAAANPTATVYWNDWPAHFDHLLWFGDSPPDLPHLEETTRGPFFRLYRIVP